MLPFVATCSESVCLTPDMQLRRRKWWRVAREVGEPPALTEDQCQVASRPCSRRMVTHVTQSL